jgi:transcriptional regulator with XRE-family HTH domain
LTNIAILSKIITMKNATMPPFPALTKQLASLGLRLRAARLRRGLGTLLFAERMHVSRDTLNRLEKGDPSIAIGTYLRALRVLGLERDLDLLAKDDELGRKLQDLQLPMARKVRGRRVAARQPVQQSVEQTVQQTVQQTAKPEQHPGGEQNGAQPATQPGAAEIDHGQAQE